MLIGQLVKKIMKKRASMLKIGNLQGSGPGLRFGEKAELDPAESGFSLLSLQTSHDLTGIFTRQG